MTPAAIAGPDTNGTAMAGTVRTVDRPPLAENKKIKKNCNKPVLIVCEMRPDGCGARASVLAQSSVHAGLRTDKAVRGWW